MVPGKAIARLGNPDNRNKLITTLINGIFFPDIKIKKHAGEVPRSECNAGGPGYPVISPADERDSQKYGH